MGGVNNNTVQVTKFPPSTFDQSVIVCQSPQSRAINVGCLKKEEDKLRFVPGRLNLGTIRESDTCHSNIQSLLLPQIQKILWRFKPQQISTITILREALACHINQALAEAGVVKHFGDAFIGA